MTITTSHHTVEVPAQCLAVQVEPVGAEQAAARAVGGVYATVLAVPGRVLWGGHSVETVARFLVRSAVAGVAGRGVTWEPVAFGPDQIVYVAVRMSVTGQ